MPHTYTYNQTTRSDRTRQFASQPSHFNQTRLDQTAIHLLRTTSPPPPSSSHPPPLTTLHFDNLGRGFAFSRPAIIRAGPLLLRPCAYSDPATAFLRFERWDTSHHITSPTQHHLSVAEASNLRNILQCRHLVSTNIANPSKSPQLWHLEALPVAPAV